MKELYYVNGGNQGYTWRQLLYWCYASICDFSYRYNYTKRKYNYTATYNYKNHQRIEEFFSRFKHNKNDGTWFNRSRQIVRFIAEYCDIKTRVHNYKIYYDCESYRVFEPKNLFVIDSYGRIIPSGLIKCEYFKYIPNHQDEIRSSSPSWWYRNRNLYDEDGCLKGYKFRQGSVPGISRHRNGYWRKCGNNRAGRAAMKRQWYRDDIYSREIFEEYKITFKMDRKEHYHNRHGNHKGRGWKRSKKRKQWM